MIEPMLIDVRETARLLGVSRSMFYQCISTGQLGITPIKTLGNKRLYSVEQLREFVRLGLPNRDKWLKILANRSSGGQDKSE